MANRFLVKKEKATIPFLWKLWKFIEDKQQHYKIRECVIKLISSCSISARDIRKYRRRTRERAIHQPRVSAIISTCWCQWTGSVAECWVCAAFVRRDLITKHLQRQLKTTEWTMNITYSVWRHTLKQREVWKMSEWRHAFLRDTMISKMGDILQTTKFTSTYV